MKTNKAPGSILRDGQVVGNSTIVYGFEKGKMSGWFAVPSGCLFDPGESGIAIDVGVKKRLQLAINRITADTQNGVVAYFTRTAQ